MELSKICVFCGSQTIGSNFYEEQTRIFAELLVKNELELIYGGADMGLMKTISTTMIALGGNVTGVIPRVFLDSSSSNLGLKKLIITESMPERKKQMAELSDAFVVLPGGAGTLDELFEMWTNLQIGLHHKPIGILNLSGYYDHLIAFIDNATKVGFITAEHRSQLVIARSPEELLDLFKKYQA
jgi:uncharacterized protein (TIGR00730 family)